MSSMKRLLRKVAPILETLFDNGQGTRMELFERSGMPNWESFKRHMSFLRAQGVIEVVPKETNDNQSQPTFDLSHDGHEFVQSLRG